MRVIGGSLRGRGLLGAGGAGFRPTQDRVREALFNILGGRVQGAHAADLFAGTGSLGIEALSRGARQVVFVEKDAEILSVLERNLDELGLSTKAEVVCSAVDAFLEQAEISSYDLILADPPYGEGMAESTLVGVAACGALAPGGIIVLECRESDPELSAPPGMEPALRRAYGGTRLEIFTRRTPAPERRAGNGAPSRQGGRR